MGVRLNRWDNCRGYDVRDRRTGDQLGTVERAGGEFHAGRYGQALGNWSTQHAAVLAVVSAARR